MVADNRVGLKVFVGIFLLLIFWESRVAFQLYGTKADWLEVTHTALRDTYNFVAYDSATGNRRFNETRLVIVTGTNYINVGGVCINSATGEYIAYALQNVLQGYGFSNAKVDIHRNKEGLYIGARVGQCHFGQTESGIAIPIGAIVQAVKQYSASSSILLYVPSYVFDTNLGHPLITLGDVSLYAIDDVLPNASIRTRNVNLQQPVFIAVSVLIIGLMLPLFAAVSEIFSVGSKLLNVALVVIGGVLVVLVGYWIETKQLSLVLIDMWFGDTLLVSPATNRIGAMALVAGLAFLLLGLKLSLTYLAGRSSRAGVYNRLLN